MTTTVYNPPKSNGGAIQIDDGEYTNSNPLEILAGVRTAVPNNGATVVEVINREGSQNWVTNGKVTPPNGNGDTYLFRVFGTFNFSVADTQGKAELDIGGTQGVIYPKSLNFNAAAGVDFQEAFEFSIYAKETFFQNGATLFLTFDEDVELHSISYFIANVNRA